MNLTIDCKQRAFDWLFIGVFLILGLLLGGTIVSGDELGRVNLLYFLAIFVLWPFLSCILLCLFSVFPTDSTWSVVRWMTGLSIWPLAFKNHLLALKRQQLFAPWLFMQSQQSVLAFSCGCLLAFFAVLLFSDIVFVWRSTLLSSREILPLLQFIALPWTLIEFAQPVQSLVVSSQEIRHLAHVNPRNYDDHWWQFLLAAQLTYVIIPRLVTTIWARFMFFRALGHTQAAAVVQTPLNKAPAMSPRCVLLSKRPQLTHYNLSCWLDLPSVMVQQVLSRFDSPPLQVYQVGHHGNDSVAASDDGKPQLLLVAAWEPPMGELHDYLLQGHGVIMLLDYTNTQWQVVAQEDIDEWQRFCNQLPQWSLFVDNSL